MSAPRILFFVHSLTIGGAERLVIQLADALSAEYRIGICCLDSRGALWEECKQKGYTLYELQRQPGWQISTFLAAKRVVAEFAPTIIHAHQYTPYLYSAIGKLLALSAAKIVFTEHGRHFPDIVSAKRRLANLLLKRMAARVTAVSEFSKDALASVEGFTGSPIEVIYNGLAPTDTSREEPTLLHHELNLDPSVPLIGYVGSLREVKNPLYLLEAFALLESSPSSAHLVYIGDGPLRPSLEQAVRSLGLEKVVHFLGARNPATPYFASLTVFAMPSHSEAASLALLEAMARGLAIVATNRGGTPELITDGDSGMLVPTGSPPLLAARLQELLVKPEQRRLLGEKARLVVGERFDFDDMVRSYQRIYEELR
jgi:glycosyltransferase involved in cell wall biosynthesis